MAHVVETEEDPLRQANGERAQAQLAVGAAHRCFERCNAALRLGAGFFEGGCKGRHAVALDDPDRRLVVENAGSQVQKADL